MSWVVEASWGSAGDFHHRDIPDLPVRSVWLHQVTRPALVMGSAQPEADVDLVAVAASGIELCRRRSGGGAVLVQPEDCWIDVVIPRGDPFWHDDVGRAFGWLGILWAQVLLELGLADCRVHRGAPQARELGRVVCFAGLGEGEVTAFTPDVGRRKVVGLSQRRTKRGARFQGLVPFGPDLSATQRYLAAPVDVAHLPVGSGQENSTVTDAFLAALAAC